MPRPFSVPSPAELKRVPKERSDFTPNPFEQKTLSPEEKLEQLFDEKIPVDMEALSVLFDRAEHDEDFAGRLREKLTYELGPKFASRLLEDWRYREALKDTARTLASKLPDSKMPVCTEGGLKVLIATREILGDQLPDFIRASDMRRHLEEEVTFEDEEEKDEEDLEGVLSTGSIQFDRETGECTGDFELGANFKLSTGEILEVFKRFGRNALPPNREGETRFERVATYEYFTVPDRLQSRGYAAREMAETVTALREGGFDRLALHANIDVGGYAWAAYGFGWDERKTAYEMAADYLRKKDDKKETHDLSEHDITQVAPDITYPSDLNEKQMIELARRKIAAFVYGRKHTLRRMLTDLDIVSSRDFAKAKFGQAPDAMPEDLQGIWYELNEMEMSPETVTPQRLATLGKDLERRLWTVRVDLNTPRSSVEWHSEETLEAARAAGRLTDEPRMAHHIGKVLLLDSSWYGSIDLQSDNENLKTLSARLSKFSRV